MSYEENGTTALTNNNANNNQNGNSIGSPDAASGIIGDSLLEKKNDEDALDFEAEEGECSEVIQEDKSESKV